ncbi:MAG: hypothetical protein NWP87_02880, partial [Winogradskyella sp.]|nr:hypothetical protein [Winogradskyella sp.]
RNFGFRITYQKDYRLKDWQEAFNIDKNSRLGLLKDFEIDPVLKVQPLSTNPNHFNVAILDKNGNAVTVDFSKEDIEEGMTFKIYDIENRSVPIKSGVVEKDLKIIFPMDLEAYEMPLHNKLTIKSANNFGVYRIEFETSEKKNFFERLFNWLF